MTGSKILVTGASGFIGFNLVRKLIELGNRVSCLIRSPSKKEILDQFGPEIVIGDISDASAVQQAVAGKDVVFHLAGTTNHSSRTALFKTNVEGTERVLAACANLSKPPVVVLVSSLAAVGPSPRKVPHREDVIPQPVSNYGASKWEAEQIARSYADRIPISIVRPPIVLGANDIHSRQLFQLIEQWRMHFYVGYLPEYFSVIHVDDLVDALIAIADRGKRVEVDSLEAGVYFAAADEIQSFSQLGRMIGQAMGKNWILRVPVPRFGISLVGAINTIVNELFRTRLFLTYDKAREATAGSWACKSEKLKLETGWAPRASLMSRLQQTTEQLKRQSLPLPRPAP